MRRGVLALLPLVALAACVAPARKQVSPAPAAPPPAQVARAAPRPETPPPAPMPLPPADSLLGRDGDAVARLLGDPSFRREDRPAEVWQFRGEACVLDLFLYPPAGGGPHRVAHYEARGRGTDPAARPSAEDCFHALLRARAARAKG
ncbi:MAG: hypothetical protein H6906_07225 [Hyphomicrobiales bacterium]|nr:hypothetical protein [Hyphomicrobiales bacterium]